MKSRSFLSVAALGENELTGLVRMGIEYAESDVVSPTLKSRIIGTYFRGSSTRTRTAFTVAALRLGAKVIAYGRDDLQLSTGETFADTARVLSSYIDGLVIRTNGPAEEMQILSSAGKMSVINAMSETEHPTQAVTDLITIYEEFGTLKGLNILYVGEGNNTAIALMFALAAFAGTSLALSCPQGYGIPENAFQLASRKAHQCGARLARVGAPTELRYKFDAVYATRWRTMGVAKAELNWKSRFEGFRVDKNLMEMVSRSDRTIFLHDLPAVRGEDVSDEVLDGKQSRAFRQAEHKLSAAVAILKRCLD